MTNAEFRHRLETKYGRRQAQPERPLAKIIAQEKIVAPLRTKCSVCGTANEASALEPGTGRCTECQP